MERFLFELLLRGLLLCLLAALTLTLLRRSAAAYRHLVCVLALFVLLVLPLAQQHMPPLRLLPPPSTTTAARMPVPLQIAGGMAGIDGQPEMHASRELLRDSAVKSMPSSLVADRSVYTVQGMAARNRTASRAPDDFAALAVTIWALGTSILLIRLIVALVRLRKLEAVSQQASLQSVSILVSDQVRTPLTWGIRRSVILMPAALVAGAPDVCESALRHEQAHIARWDWIWNLLAELVCALCWFQPGAWWLRSRLKEESERACDDRVLLSGVAAADYAAHLLQIVRSVNVHEVAPSMAQCRGLEERMRYILDAAKPRQAQTKWLVVSTPLALVLLSLAALRVSARAAEPQHQGDKGGTTAIPTAAPSSRSLSPDAAAPPAGPRYHTDAPQAPPPATALGNAPPMISSKDVTWSKTVDGLQAGLLLTSTDFSNVRRVPRNSHLAYKVLVRNVSDQNRYVEFRCSNYGPWASVPYLIPGEDLRSALSSRSLPERFRALAVSDLARASPAYAVELAPGEGVVVPEEFGLYIGDVDKQSFPRMEAFKPGMNWIIQPITIHQLSAAEAAQAESARKTPYSQKKEAVIVSRDGKNDQRSIPMFGTKSEGKPLYAGIQLEVGTNRDWSLTGHSKSVSVEVFSPDSKRLLTAGADGTAIVWAVASGQRLLTLKGAPVAISSAIYTPDGRFIITGCSDGAIYVWNAGSGEPLRSLAGHGGGVCALDSSRDGAKILAGYDNGAVKVWDLATGQEISTFACDNRLLAAAITPDGKTIAAGYADSTVHIWDLQTRNSLLSRKLSKCEGITGMHFDQNNTLYTWDHEPSDDGKSKRTVMTAWGIDDPNKGFVMLSIILFPLPKGALHEVVCYNTFSMLFGMPDGQAVLDGAQGGPVTLDAHEGAVASVAISPDGTLAATGGERNGKGEAKIWDLLAHMHAR